MRVLILPADLPLVEPTDLTALLMRGTNPPVIVIASDRRKDGTNGLYINPTGLIEYGYGPGSFQRHCTRATAAGARLEIFHSDHFGLDLDLPEDLELVGGLKGLNIE